MTQKIYLKKGISDFFHLARRKRKANTSDGSRKEYQAMVSFGIEETRMGNPFRLAAMTWNTGGGMIEMLGAKGKIWRKKKILIDQRIFYFL